MSQLCLSTRPLRVQVCALVQYISDTSPPCSPAFGGILPPSRLIVKPAQNLGSVQKLVIFRLTWEKSTTLPALLGARRSEISQGRLHRPIGSLPESDHLAVDTGNLWVFIRKRRRERLYAILLTCDLLARGFPELQGDLRCGLVSSYLQNLRITVSLELSSLAKHTPKGGWPTYVKRIWADPQDSLGLVQRVRSYLGTLVSLLSIQNSLGVGLQELEKRV